MNKNLAKILILLGLSVMALVVMFHDQHESGKQLDVVIPAPSPLPTLIPSPTPTPTTYSIQGVRERDRERFEDD